MLCKCSGKYIDIYFILKITYSSLGGMVTRVAYLSNIVAGAMEDVAED